MAGKRQIPTMVLLVGALLSGWSVGSDAKADDSGPPKVCSLYPLASLNMQTLTTGEFEVPVTLNGRSMPLLVDTGSIHISVTSEAADELGLKRMLTLNGGHLVNNILLLQTAHLDEVLIGGLHANAGWDVTIVPDNILPRTAFGLLGPDIFSTTDVEIDFYRGKFNVFLHNKCDGQVVYWTHDPYASLPIITSDKSHHIETQAWLDGKLVKVTFDTGSPNSFMSVDSARQLFGWQPNDPRVRQIGTERINNGRPTALYKYPFGSLTFYGINVLNPQIVMMPKESFEKDSRDQEVNLVLGISVLRQLHLYIDYPGNTLYLTSAEAH